LGLDLPLRVGVGPGLAANKSDHSKPTADRIADVSQPAWHFTNTLPSSPSATLRLALRSWWAGQRADQPLPDFLAPGSLANSVSTGVMLAPFRRGRLPGQPYL